MPRTIWTGSLSFGLVSIPVGLYPATSDKSFHFNQFEEGTSDRIRYKKVNERTGNEVESSRIVRGVDVGGGDYVILSDEELAAAEPERSRTIEITDFVDLSAIDPVYFRTTYYLAPQNEAARKAYALLVEALNETGKVAVATLVMRNKEYLVAIRPQPGALALETLYFADEVRTPSEELPLMGDGQKLDEREIDLAKMLVGAMTGEWEPERYHDTHRQRVQELVEQKREGKEIVTEIDPRPAATVVDLMQALQASVAAAPGHGAASQNASEPEIATEEVEAATGTDDASPGPSRSTKRTGSARSGTKPTGGRAGAASGAKGTASPSGASSRATGRSKTSTGSAPRGSAGTKSAATKAERKPVGQGGKAGTKESAKSSARKVAAPRLRKVS